MIAHDEGATANAADGICDDEPTLALLRMPSEANAARLRRFICKAPSEWDDSDLATRFARLREPGQPLENDDNWNRFAEHVGKMAFWTAAGIPERSVWYFHPIQFVRQFRNCGWLSQDELAATFPKHLFYSDSGNPRTAITTVGATYTITRAAATDRISNHYVDLNHCLRKYIGPDRKRTAIFLAQVMLETAQWRDLGGSRRLMHEWGFGAFSAANPATQYYTAFYGRGIMQLTWAGNYRDYGVYRHFASHAGAYIERLPNHSARITATSQHYGRNPADGGTEFQWSPRYDPDIVGEQRFEACDSGGFYWASKSFSEGFNINRVADRAYTASNTGFVNRLVNGGGNGYYERQAYTAFMIRKLTDSTETSLEITVSPPAPKVPVRVNMKGSE